jgi:glutathione synthase/RimK-type ligase-like ATP-grasp enzyme
MLCDDKAAQCDIFNYKKVPCFQHRYFYKIPFDFSIIKKYLKQYKEIVIKKNNGTGGQGIFRTTKFNEVKKIIEQLNYHFSLSPFYEYKNEYRVILLNGKPMLCYCKKRPFIISDGKTKLKDILESKKINLDDVKPGLNLNKVYKNGEEIEVS